MEQLIDVVFADADEAHRQHLATESFAEHEALGEFYDEVRGAVDAFVESAIGLDIPAPASPDTPVLNKLEESYIALKDMRDGLCQQDTTLENLFDNITACYTKALFKLKRLK